MANSIERKYHVKIVYKGARYLAPDVFWKDYFQEADFLPTGKIVVEVGASIGLFAIVAAKFYQAEKVIAIEPDKESFSFLLKNLKINNLNDKVIPLNIATFDIDGEIPLHLFLGAHPTKVLAKKLDSLVEELNLNRVDLLTIDTEGSELNVLKGATSLLSTLKPRIIVEVHSKQLREEVIRLLSSFGYVPVHEKINFFEPYTSVLYFKALSKNCALYELKM